MKKTYFLLVILSLFILTSCDEAVPEEGNNGRYWNPQTCSVKSSVACGVDWLISFEGNKFPENVQILFNEVVVIDECDPQSNWSVSSTSQVVEFRIANFANISKPTKVNMRVFDRHDCFLAKTEMSNQIDQFYEVVEIDGAKQILIKKKN